MRIIKLKYENVIGAGQQIKGFIDNEVNCVEFTMKGNHYQPILVGSDVWIQFPTPEWDKMITTIFNQMVDAWNDKYATDEVKDDEICSS